jgi:hypothetical protein
MRNPRKKLVYDIGNARVVLEDDSANAFYTNTFDSEDDYCTDEVVHKVVELFNIGCHLMEIDEFLLHSEECTQDAREIIVEGLFNIYNGFIEKVKEALKHVQSVYPQVTTVIFNKYGQWHYTDDNFNYINFDERIDLSLLENAADSVETLPFIYHE